MNPFRDQEGEMLRLWLDAPHAPIFYFNAQVLFKSKLRVSPGAIFIKGATDT